ncbi:MAG: hypothetical protein R3Y16_06345 [Rikenellaceae bacterium]
MTKRITIILAATMLILAPATLKAADHYAQIHPNMSAEIQNMHIWRGSEVASGVVITTDLNFSNQLNNLAVGFWGGVNTTGSYKEFNNYVTYKVGGFKLSLNDTFNFSPGASYNTDEIFNYKADETGRFIDLNLYYTISEKLPLTLQWSTVIYGRDRDSSNSHNLFSTFCYAEYRFYDHANWACDFGVGGAFALNNPDDGAIFYGTKPGLVEVSLKVEYDLVIGNYALPLFTHAMWNPQKSEGYLQIGARIFSF